MNKNLIFVMIVLFGLVGCEKNSVEDKNVTKVATTNIPLSSLNQYVGKYTYEGVNFVEQEPLGSRLQNLLGEHYLQTVVDLQMRSPMYEQNGTLYMYAKSSHEDEELEKDEDIEHKENPLHKHEILLVIDTKRDNIYVNLSTHGIKREFNEKKIPIQLPAINFK
ncbi:MAG: hypothetical protein FNT15_02255 [Sulfurovum sp.]|nr:MAG: hypothetical protein FNT15_02255 [Sulfurovum sp.]